MLNKKTERNKLSIKRTSKKTNVIGQKEYIDHDTGELKIMNVISCENQDFNFHKIWLGHIIQCLDLVGNKKIKVINFILENIDYENKLCMSRPTISKHTGISIRTIESTMKTLINNNILHMISKSVYRVNPNMIFKGQHKQRMNILIEYNKEITEDKPRLALVKK